MKLNLLCLSLLAVVVFTSTQCHAQLWQMNAAPFLYRSLPANPFVFPYMSTPRPGGYATPTLQGEFKSVARIVATYRSASGDPITFECAGVLIAERWVLTVANCVKQRGVTAETAAVVLGRYNLDVEENTTVSQTVGSNSIYVHPYYGASNPTYNFAMIRLDSPVDSDAVDAVALPTETMCTEDYTGATFPIDSCKTVATTVGWPNGAGVMQKTIVPTYYHASCSGAWKTPVVFTDASLCGGGMTYGDVCVSDRGGPLMCRDELDQWFLLGIANYGDPNCTTTATLRLPAIYARVCASLPWIENMFDAWRSPRTAAPTSTTAGPRTTRPARTVQVPTDLPDIMDDTPPPFVAPVALGLRVIPRG